MALEHVSTTALWTAGDCRSMGRLCVSRSRLLPAVDHQPRRACSAFRALPHGRWVHPRQSNPAAFLLSRTPRLRSGTLRVRAVNGCASLFHSSTVNGCSRPRAHALTHQQVVNISADVPHSQAVLSSSVSLCPHHIGRSEKGWRYQISVMRCPK